MAHTVESVERLVEKRDLIATVAALEGLPVLEAVEIAFELQKTAYNKFKDVGANVALGEWIIAQDAPDASLELRGRVKGAAYNLSSAVWRGWDEPGIDLTPDLEAKGLPTATLNLRLAVELDKPTIARARGHWLVGAHQWAVGDTEEAVTEFKEAAVLAREAGESGEATMSDAYALLAAGDPAWRKLADKLAGVEHGAFFVNQLETAARVFRDPS